MGMVLAGSKRPRLRPDRIDEGRLEPPARRDSSNVIWHARLRHMAAYRKASPGTEERTTADVAELLSRVRSGRRQGHYYVALFGLRRYDSLHVMDQARRGLTFAVFERLARNTGISQQILADLAEISARTLARRKESGRLEPDESDRLMRASRVIARAIELFEGDREAARTWLTTHLRALGDHTPLEFAKTDVGAIEVENLIGRLEHGIPT